MTIDLDFGFEVLVHLVVLILASLVLEGAMLWCSPISNFFLFFDSSDDNDNNNDNNNSNDNTNGNNNDSNSNRTDRNKQ